MGIQYRNRAPMPWDLFVFLTLTTVGFGFSVKRVMYSQKADSVSEASVAEVEMVYGRAPSDVPRSHIIDLGCVDRREVQDRLTATSPSATIRIRARLCDIKQRREQGGVRVINVSNGTEGTIFFQGKDTSFITNDVILKRGKNDLRLAWKNIAESTDHEYSIEVYQK